VATSFGASIALSVVANYEKGASFVDVVQELSARYESAYVDGEANDSAEVFLPISATSDGTTTTYELRPRVDVFGTSNTWKALRDVICVNRDVTASNNRYILLGGSAIRNLIAGVVSGSASHRVLPAASLLSPSVHWIHHPGRVAQFPLSSGSTVTVQGFGGSVGSPLAYDLILLGTK